MVSKPADSAAPMAAASAATGNEMEITIVQKRKTIRNEPMLDRPSVTFPLSYLISFFLERNKSFETTRNTKGKSRKRKATVSTAMGYIRDI